MKKVIIAAPISDLFKQVLIKNEYELIYIESNSLPTFAVGTQHFDKLSAGSQLSTLNYEFCVGIITSNKLHLNKETLEKFPHLKWIARLGSGMEIIDTKFCDENNIKYFSSAKGIANSVAEHLTGMLLSLLHNIESSFNEIKNGLWIREPNRGNELQNMTIGIIGYGHTGSAFADKLKVFTNHILVYDKYKTDFGTEIIHEVSLEEIQQDADIISFHVPLNNETTYYYTENFITQMKKPHILLNASRGAVVNTKDVLNGLASGKIIGACLDVLDEEKHIAQLLTQIPNIVNDLMKYRVIITPHIAGYSHQAIEKMSDELLSQLKNIF